METKLRVKTGTLELDFEGSQDFLRDELIGVLETLLLQHPRSEAAQGAAINRRPNTPAVSTSSIAARFSAQSGPDLILAACSNLTFIAGQEVFSRKEIGENMKTATAYFRATYLANFSKYLQSLVRSGKLIERSAGTYSLSAGARSEMETLVRDARNAE